MLNFIAFLLSIIGAANWLSIGLFQYDFVAGLFGFQASIFSRAIYIIVGASMAILVFSAFKNKGTISVLKFKKKNKKQNNSQEIESQQPQYVKANVEAQQEFVSDREKIQKEYERQHKNFNDYEDYSDYDQHHYDNFSQNNSEQNLSNSSSTPHDYDDYPDKDSIFNEK